MRRVSIWRPHYLLVRTYFNLGPAHVSSTRRAGTRRAERWLSRCRPASRRPRTRTTPGKPPASSTLGFVHTWAGDVGLGTPAVVGPRRSPRLACSPSRAAEITLAPGCIKPGPVNRDRDFVCATPTPRRHAPRGMQLISGSARAFKLGFRSRSSALCLRWQRYVILSVLTASFPLILVDIPDIATGPRVMSASKHPYYDVRTSHACSGLLNDARPLCRCIKHTLLHESVLQPHLQSSGRSPQGCTPARVAGCPGLGPRPLPQFATLLAPDVARGTSDGT